MSYERAIKSRKEQIKIMEKTLDSEKDKEKIQFIKQQIEKVDREIERLEKESRFKLKEFKVKSKRRR